jgi:NTE family protein
MALGGGGARGFAHLGVLQVFDELGLSVRAVAGTSMGAVTGAMYLALGSADAAIERWRQAIARELVPPIRPMRKPADSVDREHPLIQVARKIRNRIVVSFAMNRTTVLDDEDLVRAFEFLVPDVSIEDLPRPFLAVTTDLEDGREVRLGRGPLNQALKASSAIPGLLPAVEIDHRLLVDGAVVAEVPVGAARSLGWPVIAVDASMDLPPMSDEALVLDTMMRTQMMTARLLRNRVLSRVRGVIRPEVGCAAWADWHEFDRLVEAGRTAAREFFGLPD